MKMSNGYIVFDVVRYTYFGVMFPTTLSITALNMGYTTIGGYINSFFKQAKVSIALVFSSKLQDIFARGRQGAWSAQKCQRRQVLQILPKTSHPVCTCLGRVMVCYLLRQEERFLKSAHAKIRSR